MDTKLKVNDVSFGARPGMKKNGCPKISKSEMKNRRKRMTKINGQMIQLKIEMEEISKDQGLIRQGQKEVREKFEAIEIECQQLRKDTRLMVQNSFRTKIHLVLMFQILKARNENDFEKATHFTRILRQIMTNNNQN